MLVYVGVLFIYAIRRLPQSTSPHLWHSVLSDALELTRQTISCATTMRQRCRVVFFFFAERVIMALLANNSQSKISRAARYPLEI